MTTMTARERFLAACAGAPIDHAPVWFMRQAGRHLPEYRALRRDLDFWTALTTPDIAARITLQPVERYGVDAAVLFSDILVALPAIGAPVTFEGGKGPRVLEPVRDAEAVDALGAASRSDLSFLGGTCRAVREAAPDTAIVGFSGAPFTLAAYLVEGGGSKDWARTRALLYDDPETFGRLLAKTATAAEAQIDVQIEAGADVIQVFDSWAEVLSADVYRDVVLPHLSRLVTHVQDRGLPCIAFAKGSPHLLEVIAESPAQVLGVDWRVPLDVARHRTDGRALQGNLDPALMAAAPEVAVAATRRALAAAGPTGHILNTGHGLSPEARPETVDAVVKHVQNATLVKEAP